MGDSIENSLYDVRTWQIVDTCRYSVLRHVKYTGSAVKSYKLWVMNPFEIGLQWLSFTSHFHTLSWLSCTAGWKSMFPVPYCASGRWMRRSCWIEPIHQSCLCLCWGKGCFQEDDWPRISGCHVSGNSHKLHFSFCINISVHMYCSSMQPTGQGELVGWQLARGTVLGFNSVGLY